MSTDEHPCCYGGHCCVIHGCKYNDDDCPIVNETRVQEGGCWECGEDQKDPPSEYDDAPYGCPRCGSTRVVFSCRYDKPADRGPTLDDPLLYFVVCLTCKHEGQWAEFKGHKSRHARSTAMANPLNMGHLIEGVVEQDPLDDRYYIRTIGQDGKPGRFDVQEALATVVGKEVRFTLVSFENLAKLAEMVEQGAGQVTGLGPEGLPGFNVERKPE